MAAVKAVLDAARHFSHHRADLRAFRPASDKPQVLVVCPNFDIGGGERVVLDVASLLSAECDFHAVSTDRSPHRWLAEFQRTFHIVRVPERWRQGRAGFLRYLSGMIAGLGIRVLVLYENQPTFDVLPEVRRRFPHLRIVDITHCEYEEWRFDRMSATIPLIDARVCISGMLRDYMLDLYRRRGIAPEYALRVRHISNGIDFSLLDPERQPAGKLRARLGIPADRPVIGWAARFTHVKNPLLMLEIARSVKAAAGDRALHFVVAGDGPEMPRCREFLAANPALADCVSLPGMLPPKEVRDLLADCFALCLTSSVEGVPLILAEAMAMGVVPVSTICGAVEELIHDGETGYLVPQGPDAGAQFRERLLAMVGNSAALEPMRARAREDIRARYGMEAMRAGYREAILQ